MQGGDSTHPDCASLVTPPDSYRDCCAKRGNSKFPFSPLYEVERGDQRSAVGVS